MNARIKLALRIALVTVVSVPVLFVSLLFLLGNFGCTLPGSDAIYYRWSNCDWWVRAFGSSEEWADRQDLNRRLNADAERRRSAALEALLQQLRQAESEFAAGRMTPTDIAAHRERYAEEVKKAKAAKRMRALGLI